MLHYRVTIPEDVQLIDANEYLNISKELVIQGLSIPTLKAWSFINNKKVIAIILANEFCKDFYSIGIIVCKDIKPSELKYIKRSVKEIVKFYGAKYVYSEGETHPVKDKFHQFMGFEIEKDLGIFKKWQYKM